MTTIDISTPKQNGTPVREIVTRVSHVAEDTVQPVHSETQRRALLPSNSPSSALSPREKRRRQNTSSSPERPANVSKEPKKRKLNRQSCSYCRKDREKVKRLFSSFIAANYSSVYLREETGQARNVIVVPRRTCLVRRRRPRGVKRADPKTDHVWWAVAQAFQVMSVVIMMMLLKLCALLLQSSVLLKFAIHTLHLRTPSASMTPQQSQI